MARKRRNDAAPIPRKTGRKLIPIDPKLVAKLAAIGCPDEEIGDIVGASGETVARRFGEVLIKARATMKQKLRQAQYRAALAGDRTMLVWLGKTMLGQKETTVSEFRDVSKMTDAELEAERKKLGLR